MKGPIITRIISCHLRKLLLLYVNYHCKSFHSYGISYNEKNKNTIIQDKKKYEFSMLFVLAGNKNFALEIL